MTLTVVPGRLTLDLPAAGVSCHAFAIASHGTSDTSDRCNSWREPTTFAQQELAFGVILTIHSQSTCRGD